MTQYKNYFIGFICLLLGASISIFKKPSIEYKESIKIIEVEKKQTNIDKNTHTEILEIKRPDGTVETKTTIVDNDKISISQETKKELDKKIDYKSTLLSKHRFETYLKTDRELIPRAELSYTYKQSILFGRVSIDQNKDWGVQIGIGLEI